MVLGNILEIAREVQTNFPYIPGSSLRGSLRNEVASIQPDGKTIADKLFGKELSANGQMGVHQVWLGDARLLWVFMGTMAQAGSSNAFTWVSCHSLIRDRALVTGQPCINLPDRPVGTKAGTYIVADAEIQVAAMSNAEIAQLSANWATSLQDSVKLTWEQNHIVLPDSDFQVLMEHSLWTQLRNKIQDNDSGNSSGAAEDFWTDVCIPRDTIFYFSWGYNLLKDNAVSSADHDFLMDVMQGLLQVGGQANVGRGWVQCWVADENSGFLTNRIGAAFPQGRRKGREGRNKKKLVIYWE